MQQYRNISLGTLQISDRAKELIMDTLSRNRLSHGPYSAEFEQKFAKLHNRSYAMYTASGTCALQVAVHALKKIHDWQDGDEVLVPAVTFIASSNVILQNNLRPVFVDIDPVTYNIDPQQLEQHITKRTRAIMPVHLFGLPCDMDPILQIAEQYELKIIEDSCETMLVKYKGRPVGSLGHIGCFSTYTAHLLTTGVGGLALTNDPQYAEKMKSLMNHGRDSIYLTIDQDDDLQNERQIFEMADRRFSFVDVGYSYRLTEMEAALGLEGIETLPSDIAIRQKNAAYLTEHLSAYSALQLPVVPSDREHAFMMFPIVLREGSMHRDDIILFLEKRGIETRYMMPLLNQPIYKEIFGDIEDKYPVAKYINNNGFYIGCHQNLDQSDLDYVISVFRDFVQ